MELLYLLLAVVGIILLTTRLRVHPFLALFVISIAYGLAAGMPFNALIESINTGFGGTLGKIGIIILFGVIIGAFLENTGGAFSIAERVLRWIGRKRVTTAMGLIGYIISIPVFADSGFLLLHPLNKSLSKRAKLSITGTAVALGLGLLASHTLVPPTPGPIAAAGILDANLGYVIALGIPVSLFALFGALLFARHYAAKTYIDPAGIGETTDIPDMDSERPGALLSAIPVIVPIVLIIAKSILDQTIEEPAGILAILAFLGEPVISLFVGVLLCLFLPKKLEAKMLSSSGWVGNAVKEAASIILITGAGGIFGKVLFDSGIADALGQSLVEYHLGLFLPFILAAALKTAQGSSTVALITTASILLPMLSILGLDSEWEKAMVVVAIGAGSSVISHANDSFFWVVTQMSGMNVRTGYRLFSLGSLVLGLTAILVLMVISRVIA